MEKRFALALGLSFLFFVVWGRIFPAVNSPVSLQQTKTIENKEVASFSVGSAEPAPQSPIQAAESSKNIPEEVLTIENDKIRVFISNLGARIVKVEFKEYAGEEFFVNSGAVLEYRTKTYAIASKDGQKISLIGRFEGVSVATSYELSENEYTIFDKTRILNETNEAKVVNAEIEHVYLDGEWLKETVDATTGEKKDIGRDKNLLEYSIYSNGNVLRKTGAFEFKEKEKKQEFLSAEWFGYRNRYFCFISRPDYTNEGFVVNPIDKNQLSLFAISKEVALNRGEAVERNSFIYVGPQKASDLSKYSGNLEKIQVYFRFEFLDAIAKIIQDAIIFFHKGIPNWGVCIILVSILIYGLMYPLTFKSLLSMKKMQSLQPKIQTIREKHEENPQKLNQEIMKLYAEHKINPLGGCLPIFLQMPIFIGLYQVLWRSVWFKGAGFLWIKDLSEPDRLMLFSKHFPVVGNELNILPLVMMVLMFVQQKMSTRSMATTDPNQLAQQKMMTTIFPLFLGFIFYKLASGLSLYFTMFYMMSIVSQMLVAKHMNKDA